MNKVNNLLKEFKDEVKGIMGTMLVSERLNSQRCIAKDLDTTKTIIDQKEKENIELSDNEMKKLHESLSGLVGNLKGLGDELLVSERINTQRCIAKDIDTTKTIIDHKEENAKEEVVKIEEIQELANEAKDLVQAIATEKIKRAKECDEKIAEDSKNEISKLAEELKTLMSTLLVGERLNTQRCIAKDIDTTKTIIDHKK